MKKLAQITLVLFALSVLFPAAIVSADTFQCSYNYQTTYSTPGSYSLTIPSSCSCDHIIATIQAGGGGGGGTTVGSAGGDSSYTYNGYTYTAHGGTGGWGLTDGINGGGGGGNFSASPVDPDIFVAYPLGMVGEGGTPGTTYYSLNNDSPAPKTNWDYESGGNGGQSGDGLLYDYFQSGTPGVGATIPLTTGGNSTQVGGGGGGGSTCVSSEQCTPVAGSTAGGGGGAFLENYYDVVPSGTISITVGSGGAGGPSAPPGEVSGFASGAGAGGTGGNGAAQFTCDYAPSCSISFNPTSTDSGTSTMSWTSHNADWLYISGIGYVPASGSAQVSTDGPGETEFTGSVYDGSQSNPPTATCSNELNQPLAGGGSAAPPPPPSPSCKLTLSPSTISSGSSATLKWSSSDAVSLSISPGIGSVKTSGSTAVSPTSSTKYTAIAEDSSGDQGSCNVTLKVGASSPATSTTTGGGPSTCSTGYSKQGASCVFTGCPSGYTHTGNQCVANPTQCAVGYTLQGNKCVFNACPMGYTKEGNSCVFTGCAVGYTEENNQCVFTGCTAGYVQQGSQCILAPVAPTGDITASPVLVQVGQTSQISWSASGVKSCSVTGTNGDAWNCSGSACAATSTETSGLIGSATIYTLSCQAQNGSTLTDSATVNIVPVFNEQ